MGFEVLTALDRPVVGLKGLDADEEVLHIVLHPELKVNSK